MTNTSSAERADARHDRQSADDGSGLVLADLRVTYGAGATALRAVDGVDLSVPRGSTLALVGESGCGKSTIAKAIVGLAPSVGGQILLGGMDVTTERGRSAAHFRRRVQMIFQDPYSSLNPRMTVAATLDEALALHTGLNRVDRRARAAELLDLVAMSGTGADKYPAEFSGGQRQRIAIARALATDPEVVIADEITSALDVSVQASILNLMREIQARTGVAVLLITHNLAVARYFSHRTAVMYLGRIVENGDESLYTAPRHPYTRALLDASPSLAAHREDRVPLAGDLPDPHDPPSGCRFRSRCPVGPLTHQDRTVCIDREPPVVDPAGLAVACHFPPEQPAGR
ncbi:ABC transporter ATP-binding protein [Nakamurella lactea]|jgi:oligopeptide/dipeptide ABC transporter ATP-binding protein|uniref:ABC transporter ATP-binding protein n=1 Tax=Nakamurella lactea TaxID=459515 RepID=UPI000423C61A|nr:ABC transporter ATP-binding protein [Nakamurella lactea]